jgi:phage gp29-like protein
MSAMTGLVQSMKGWLGKPLATPESDPTRYFGTMLVLPNPDPILREMGRADPVYYSIMADPHVMGEVRSIRGSFRSHQYRLTVGSEDDPKAAAALELCEQWMKSQPPNAISDWLEVMWQMTACIFTGYRAHELVWDMVGGKLLPTQVLDRPGRRFKFDMHGAPLLVSRDHWYGQPVEPYQFIISRHMPTMDNPYGMALLSSCFWPWTFKTGGWRYFVKYCERHGLPWPVGSYPQGSSEGDIDALAEALGSMVEAGYIVKQEGSGIELLTPNGSGSNLPQQSLINLCNKEMSKALTSQAMVGEQLSVGARAASDTAMERQNSVHDSDRDIAASSMAQIFKWVTLFNLGEGVSPPTLDFYKHEPAGKERAEAYQIVANMGAKPSRSAMLEELGIPEAEDDADALLPVAKAQAVSDQFPGTGKLVAPSVDLAEVPSQIDFNAIAGFTFAKAAGMTEDEAVQLAADAADQAIEDKMIAPIYQMLVQFEKDGKTLAQFQSALGDIVGQMDDEGLREVLDRALSYSILRGAATGAA